MRCLDAATSEAMVAEVDAARKDGDTLGGVVEVLAYGLPPGLGSHTQWDRRLDARLAGALMSVQAIKGVDFGDGFTTAGRRGSGAHDEISLTADGIRRATNRAGGVEGGMTTGELLRVRAAMKPISTVPRALATVDVLTGEAAKAINQRSDVTRGPGGRGGRRGHGGAGAGRGGGGEVRRRLRGRDAPQRRGLPEEPGDLVSSLPGGVTAEAAEGRGTIALIGPPASGKSSVGALLAAGLGLPLRGYRRPRGEGGRQAGR